MAAKNPRRPKHIPQRTCVGCREVLPKRNLIRLVRTIEGIVIDPSGKLAGRGAYLHDQRSCWEKGIKGALAGALRTEVREQDRVMLRAFMEGLPAESSKTIDSPVDPTNEAGMAI